MNQAEIQLRINIFNTRLSNAGNYESELSKVLSEILSLITSGKITLSEARFIVARLQTPGMGLESLDPVIKGTWISFDSADELAEMVAAMRENKKS